MRILTVCYEFPPVGGGGARVAHGLARQFVREGHHVHFLSLGYGTLPVQESVDGIRLRRVTGWRARADITRPHELASYLWQAREPLRKLLKTQHFDLVHLHFLFPDGLLALLVPELCRYPLVATVHGSDVPGFNPDRFMVLHRLLRPLWQRVVRRMDRIVCPSQFIASLLLQHAPLAQPVVIPNGIDPRAELSTNRRPELRLLTVSRLLERKGVQDLINALPLMRGAQSVHIVGSGPYQQQLEKLAAPLGERVRFLGWLDSGSAELQGLYETSEIFVFCSRSENFPVVLLEAMAAGLAIVASDIPSCREVLGEAAVFVRPGDLAALAAALDGLASDVERRSQLQHAARQRLDENFRWPITARR